MNAATLEQTILWRRIDYPGYDACGLWALDSGWHLAGTAVFCFDKLPCHLSYEVDCDPSWRTRSATVDSWIGREAVKLVMVAMPGERWNYNGAEQAAVAGCVDVDLNFTPATNLIALRRLALKVGEKSGAPAAWLRFPDFVFERLDQQYHRVDPNRYDYEAPGAGYAAPLDVTDSGFVTRYPGLWEMEALG